MKLRQASPRKKWHEYTEAHVELKEYLENLITEIHTGGERDPVALVGPYRTGKTQLLYEAFMDSWEKGVPALYVSANDIITEFTNQEGEPNIADWLSNRVATQADSVRNGESADWLPNWNSSVDENEFLQEVSENDFKEDSKVLLLVDEIEQAYTRLRKGDFVDDENPLRVLLDDTEGIQHIWAFGLVAAYELGEADYGRFDERRLPILEVSDVRDALSEHDKNPELAHGIWWLARGRIGWTNKLIDELPEDDDDLATWVRQISEEEFEGVNPLNKEIWTEQVQETSWDNARRSIMFLQGEFTKWELSHPDGASLPADSVANLTLGILDEMFPQILTPGAKQVLERNLRRLCASLALTEDDGKLYLPQNLLNELPEIDGYFDLLGDLIVSFEGGTDARADATKCLQHIEPDEFRRIWGEKFHRHIEEGIGAWTIRPSVISQAYPAIAVDPNQLNQKNREEIQSELDRGVAINPDVPREFVEYEVRYCPSQRLVEVELEHASNPSSLNKVFVIIAEDESQITNLDSKYQRLVKLNRVHLHAHSATRLWDFVVHLQEYLEDTKAPESINQRRVDQAIAEEEEREKRNTLSTLFEQLDNISETQVSIAIEQFTEKYSRRSSEVPIWGEDLSGESGDETNPPAVYGSGTISLHSFAYALSCSRYEIGEISDFASVRSTLLSGLEEQEDEPAAYVDSRAFGYTQFVRSTLNDTGLSEPLRRFSRRFHAKDGIRDSSIDNLQELMLELKEENDEGELLKRLLDPSAERHDISVIDNTNFNQSLAYRFVWGLLLEEVAVRNNGVVRKKTENTLELLTELNERLTKAKGEVKAKNEQLSTPGNFGKPVTIRSDTVTNRISHIKEFEGPLSEIEAHSGDKDFAGIGVVYSQILAAYFDNFEDGVNDLELALYGSQLMNIDNLKAGYNKVRESLRNNEVIYSEIDHDKEDALAELDDQANKLFDFEGVIGTSRLAPTDSDSFEELNEAADKGVEHLEELHSKIIELEALIAERENLQEGLQKQFSTLAERVAR